MAGWLMVVSTRGWISVGPGPISVRCGGWNDWMRFVGAYWLMGSLSERPKGRCSGRDFTRTGFLALASLMISSAPMRPCVMRSTSPAQRVGTYSILIQWWTTARSSWKARATSAWLPKISTRRSAQFTTLRVACQDWLDKPVLRGPGGGCDNRQPADAQIAVPLRRREKGGEETSPRGRSARRRDGGRFPRSDRAAPRARRARAARSHRMARPRAGAAPGRRAARRDRRLWQGARARRARGGPAPAARCAARPARR